MGRLEISLLWGFSTPEEGMGEAGNGGGEGGSGFREVMLYLSTKARSSVKKGGHPADSGDNAGIFEEPPVPQRGGGNAVRAVATIQKGVTPL